MQPRPPNPTHKRMKREKQTIAYMVDLYCKAHHSTHGELCSECREFKEYAFLRLDKCPFQEKKSTCGKCVIQCYRPGMKQKVKVVMRYAGPRMLLRHPGLALHHVWDGHREPPTLAKKPA
ncbi:MAG: nitrous oxide-stimulated promoter family protein [Nitrososphaerota archaeon]|nr:nitrous oxide-stimulated promoter family protein [Nitrososphaerota archaeon]